MKNQVSNFNYILDIKDYKNDKEIIKTIKTILKLNRDEKFQDSLSWVDSEPVSVEVSPNISFIIRGCDCE